MKKSQKQHFLEEIRKIDRSREKKLFIILPCSAGKAIERRSSGSSKIKYLKKWTGKEAAVHVYQGPLWKSLRQFFRTNPSWYNSSEKSQNTKLYVLSAKYGLIDAETKKIEPYDTLLGRDISEYKFKEKLWSQVRALQEKKAIPYAFVSRRYAKVLRAAGLTFYYVKGGIGSKRPLLKKLLSSPGYKLPKKDVELYDANEYRLGNDLYNGLKKIKDRKTMTPPFPNPFVVFSGNYQTRLNGGAQSFKKLIAKFEKEKMIQSHSYLRTQKKLPGKGFARGENWRKLSRYKDLSNKRNKNE
jgi:hypothetical protein